MCLTGVSSGGRTIAVDAGGFNRELVLENNVVFGTVNANRPHYQAAAAALTRADAGWLDRLITRRVPLALAGRDRAPTRRREGRRRALALGQDQAVGGAGGAGRRIVYVPAARFVGPASVGPPRCRPRSRSC